MRNRSLAFETDGSAPFCGCGCGAQTRRVKKVRPVYNMFIKGHWAPGRMHPWKTGKRQASCHPELWNHSEGLCQPCYVTAYNKRKAVRVRKAAWAKANPQAKELRAQRARDYYAANREAVIAKRRANPARVRGWRYKWEIKKKYGLTAENVATMLEYQQRRCAICLAPGNWSPEMLGKNLHIDHDHNTGRARALLCDTCNKGIGQFHDDPVITRAAAEYLERNWPGIVGQRHISVGGR